MVDIDALEKRVCKASVVDAEALTTLTKALERESLATNPDHDEDLLKLVHACRRTFSTLIKRGDLDEKRASVETALSEYYAWIQAQFRRVLESLAAAVMAQKRGVHVHVVAVRTLFHLYQHPCDAASAAEIVECVFMPFLLSDAADDTNSQVFRVLKEEYLEQYDDLRYTFLHVVKRVSLAVSGREDPKASMTTDSTTVSIRNIKWLEQLENVGEKRVAKRLLHLLLCIDLKSNPIDLKTTKTSKTGKKSKTKLKLKCLIELNTKDQRHKGAKELTAKQLRKAFQTAWLAYLKLAFDKVVYRNVLEIVGDKLLPNCSNPLLLSEFLIEACDLGGTPALLALEALFRLMSEHGLEYADFYMKLYNLIDPLLFASKNAAKLYTLIDLFLTSSHLSHHMVAAFIKKFARMTLRLPPPGILVSLVFIHNLIKRHPSTLILVHKTVDNPGEAERRRRIEGIREASIALAQGKTIDKPKEPCLDPYKPDETDPIQSNAGDSSLWELSVLQHHYSPAVVSLVNGMFMEELAHSLETKKFEPPIPLADFASASYTSMFVQELKRKSKKRKGVAANVVNAPALAIKRNKDESVTGWSCLNF